MIVAAVIVAVLAVAFGTQVLARYVQRHGTDLRSAGPLLDLRRTEVPTIQPADFDELEGLVSDGLVSDAYMSRELLPLLRSLAAEAPKGAIVIEAPGRLGRSAWLNRTLEELEAGWEITPPT
ncbi:MAG: hypothetical protein ACI8TP_000107 [Acidimicrobiales bacterium]|jgi:hypothetical protein